MDVFFDPALHGQAIAALVGVSSSTISRVPSSLDDSCLLHFQIGNQEPDLWFRMSEHADTLLVYLNGKYIGQATKLPVNGGFRARVNRELVAYDSDIGEAIFVSAKEASQWLKETTSQRLTSKIAAKTRVVEAILAHRAELEQLGWHLHIKHTAALFCLPQTVWTKNPPYAVIRAASNGDYVVKSLHSEKRFSELEDAVAQFMKQARNKAPNNSGKHSA